MKKLVIAFLLVIMTVFACSCNDIIRSVGNEFFDNKSDSGYISTFTSNEYYSYMMLWTSRGHSFGGLAILHGDDNSSDFVKFDDDASYYNRYISEWFLACGTALYLYFYTNNAYNNRESINNYLNCIHCMPNCLEKYGVVDPEIKEIFLESYYNARDIGLYEPTRRYGSWKYPYDSDTFGACIELFRIQDGEFENIPGGTLGIRASTL